ncbi:Inner membrane ABC transporter permease protein YdcV [Bdellovibrio bacteriovorus]|nr:spermidine/putrescine ABC transporter permease [Bdellovibrio bacteriovorus]BEV67868.1 Inner membrane ABC transporter permease protein YdcV [Bdellovibrio bacteriovorus]
MPVVERSRPQAPMFAKVVLWITLLLLHTPILVMILGALIEKKPDSWSWTLRWFSEVVNDQALMDALKNSLLVGVAASLLSTVIGTSAAVGLHRSAGGWRWAVEGLSVVSLVFPEIVFALSLLSLFFILQFELGLMTVVISHVSFSISYVMITVGARLATLDRSFEDAARDLGASEWQTYRSVVLPLLGPSIVGGGALSFLLSFDDFLITYFVNGVGQDTLPVKLYTAMKLGVSPKLNALSSLMFVMTLLALIFFFRSSAFRVFFEARGKHESKSEKENP